MSTYFARQPNKENCNRIRDLWESFPGRSLQRKDKRRGFFFMRVQNDSLSSAAPPPPPPSVRCLFAACSPPLSPPFFPAKVLSVCRAAKTELSVYSAAGRADGISAIISSNAAGSDVGVPLRTASRIDRSIVPLSSVLEVENQWKLKTY